MQDSPVPSAISTITPVLLGFSRKAARRELPESTENTPFVTCLYVTGASRIRRLTSRIAAAVALLVALLAAPACAGEPAVYVLGDSISIGYTPHLAAAAFPHFAVEHNPGNAYWTAHTLAHLDAWLPVGARYDAIVCGIGLHDLRWQDGAVITPLAEYEANLHALYGRLLENTACLVVPTITWVTPAAVSRTAERVRAYNAVVRRVAGHHGAVIVDLYGITDGREDWYTDGVHMTPWAYEVLGGAVARAALDATGAVPLPTAGGLGLFITAGILCAVVWFIDRRRP